MADQNWVPFRAFTTLEQEIHELLDRVGGRSWTEGFGWRPDTDICRAETGLVVELELPGVDPHQDLTVEVEENVLQISGRTLQSPDITETDRLVTERRYGPFHREVMLPDGVDPSGITASFSNGVLTVSVTWPTAPAGKAASNRVSVDVTVEDRLPA